MNMDAFVDACSVEDRGRSVLEPFLRRHAYNGQYVMTNKGILARHLQETVGDVLFNSDREIIWSVEIKVEEIDDYGNFYLETWSNKNLCDRKSHAELGSNPGWMYKLRSDLLFYFFLSSDELFIINFFKLKRWFFAVAHQNHPNMDRFEERPQKKRFQLNDTWGRCVPIKVVEREVGFTKLFPRQIELFE